jgi:hypothetical protein
MSNWVDELKRSKDANNREQRQAREMAIHRDGVIRAKAPAFWENVIDRMREDLADLRSNFPADASLHAQVIAHRDGFTLENETRPVRVLDLRLNAEGHCVELSESRKFDNFEQTAFRARYPVGMKVDENEDVVFVWRGAECKEPRQLAKLLIEYVCGINE